MSGGMRDRTLLRSGRGRPGGHYRGLGANRESSEGERQNWPIHRMRKQDHTLKVNRTRSSNVRTGVTYAQVQRTLRCRVRAGTTYEQVHRTRRCNVSAGTKYAQVQRTRRYNVRAGTTIKTVSINYPTLIFLIL